MKTESAEFECCWCDEGGNGRGCWWFGKVEVVTDVDGEWGEERERGGEGDCRSKSLIRRVRRWEREPKASEERYLRSENEKVWNSYDNQTIDLNEDCNLEEKEEKNVEVEVSK